MLVPSNKWPKGTGGNPSGRPQGSRNKTTLAVEALLGGEAEGLTRKAIEIALAGDIGALKLCLERIAPVRKDREVAFSLGNLETATDVSAALSDILRAVSEGQITHLEGEIISRVLDAKHEAIATVDYEQRIMALEIFMKDLRELKIT